MNLKYSAISKVLPCVYDDSLSYYEVLGKVRDKLNEVIDVDNAQSDAINDLGEQSAERYNKFEQKIINDLEEMENKLEGEISAGDDEVLQTLSELIANLSNEIDDVSASVSGIESSVADAVQTANQANEAVNELSNDVDTVTQNVADLNTAMNNVDGTLQQMNGRINTNESAIATNTGDISALGERVTDIEEEIEGGMVFADVDSNLSTTSTNPVENQAITRKIQQVEGDIPSQLDDLSDVNLSNPSAGQVAGFDSNGNLINMNAPAGVTVVDNLNSTSATDALSANQGKILNDKIMAVPFLITSPLLNQVLQFDGSNFVNGKTLPFDLDVVNGEYGYYDQNSVFHPFKSQADIDAAVADAMKGDAVSSDVLSGKTFTNANNSGVTGTMPNIGSVLQSLLPSESYNIPQGYHDGTGVVSAVANSGTFSATQRSASIDMGENNTYRYINTNGVPSSVSRLVQVWANVEFTGNSGSISYTGGTSGVPSSATAIVLYDPSYSFLRLMSGSGILGAYQVGSGSLAFLNRKITSFTSSNYVYQSLSSVYAYFLT